MLLIISTPRTWTVSIRSYGDCHVCSSGLLLKLPRRGAGVDGKACCGGGSYMAKVALKSSAKETTILEQHAHLHGDRAHLHTTRHPPPLALFFTCTVKRSLANFFEKYTKKAKQKNSTPKKSLGKFDVDGFYCQFHTLLFHKQHNLKYWCEESVRNVLAPEVFRLFQPK